MAQCGLCKDCKWWSKEHYKSSADTGVCERDEEDGVGYEAVDEYNYYDCFLRTHEDFGCIQFEPKEQ